jgi:hypothetical protein
MIKAQNVFVSIDAGAEVPHLDISAATFSRRFIGVRGGSLQLQSLASGTQTLQGTFVIQGSNVTTPLAPEDWVDLAVPGIAAVNLGVSPCNQAVSLIGPPMRYNRIKWVHTSGAGRIRALFFHGNELASDQ